MNLSIAGLLAPEPETAPSRGAAPARPLNEDGGVDRQNGFEQAFAQSETAEEPSDAPRASGDEGRARNGEAAPSLDADPSAAVSARAAAVAEEESDASSEAAATAGVGIDAVSASGAVDATASALVDSDADVDGDGSEGAVAIAPVSGGALDALDVAAEGRDATRPGVGSEAPGAGSVETAAGAVGEGVIGEARSGAPGAALSQPSQSADPAILDTAPRGDASTAETALANAARTVDGGEASSGAPIELPSRQNAAGAPAEATLAAASGGASDAVDSASPLNAAPASGDLAEPALATRSADGPQTTPLAGAAVATSSAADALGAAAHLAPGETPVSAAASQFAAALVDGEESRASFAETPRDVSPRSGAADVAAARPLASSATPAAAADGILGNTLVAASTQTVDTAAASLLDVDNFAGDEAAFAAQSAGSGAAGAASSASGGLAALATPAGQAQLGAAAATQVAAAIVQSDGDSRIELRLDPPELGRVDIEFSFEKDATRVVLRAEREDALDLLRRHADDLLRDLRDAGYDVDHQDLDFGGMAFGRDEAQGETAGDDGGETRRTQAMIAVDAAGVVSPRTASGGLDLRV